MIAVPGIVARTNPVSSDSVGLSDLPVDPQSSVSLMNDHREAEEGCSRLDWDTALGDVAQEHSQEMHDRGLFSHNNPDGDDPFDRMNAAGISYTAAGENIAQRQSTGQVVSDSRINSSGHRENIEKSIYTPSRRWLRRGWSLLDTRVRLESFRRIVF